MTNSIEIKCTSFKNKIAEGPKFKYQSYCGLPGEAIENPIDAVNYYSKEIDVNSQDHYAYICRAFARAFLARITSNREWEELIDKLEPWSKKWEKAREHYLVNKHESDLIREDADNDLDLAISINKELSNLYFYRSYLKKSSSDQEAIDDCTRAIEINPTNIYYYQLRGELKTPEIHNNWGVNDRKNYSADDINRFHEAMYDFTKAIELQPDFVDAYVSRSYLKAEIDDLIGAKKDFEQAQLLSMRNRPLTPGQIEYCQKYGGGFVGTGNTNVGFYHISDEEW